MEYRKDIDGLRAVAIMAVVFFHAKLPGFPGGFIGVDVFFVISGYLITGMMLQDFRAGRFSVRTFYARRVRRIIPALLVVYLASGVLAALVMLPSDAAEYGRSLRSSALFISNLFFYSLADYFGGASDLKPLLHTWSLSVEEQYYLVWPLLFWTIIRRRPQLLVAVTCVLGFSSFAGFVAALGSHKEAAFFLTPFRVWELMLGAAIVLSPRLPTIQRTYAELLAAAGLILIVASVVFFNEGHSGLNVAAACFGTALLILIGIADHRPIAIRLLASSPMVGIGLISYSLYLWHWPILAFARYALDRPLLATEVGGCLCLSLALAFLTYRYVEQPARRMSLRFSKPIIGVGFASLGAFILLGHQIDRNRGWTFNIDPQIRQLDMISRAENKYRRDCNGPNNSFGNETSCTFGRTYAPGRYDVAIFGDSHANHYAPAIAEMAERRGWSGRQLTVGGCLALLGYYEIISPYANKARCRSLREGMVRFVEENPHLQLVVLAHAWFVYTGIKFDEKQFYLLAFANDERSPKRSYEVMRESLEQTVNFFEKKGIRVLLLSEVPPLTIDPVRCQYKAIRSGESSRSCGRSLKEVRDQLGPMRSLLFDLPQRHKDVVVFDPLNVMCEQNWCNSALDGVLMYHDNNHLNLFGAQRLAGPIDEFVAKSEVVEWRRADPVRLSSTRSGGLNKISTTTVP